LLVQAGGTATVLPPAAVDEPARIAILDHGRHTSLVLEEPGGAVVLTPDATREIFSPGTDRGGHDGEGGRSLRYLEWTHAPDPPEATTYVVDYAILVREPGKPVRIVHDQHTLGVFPEATWHRLIAEAGLELVDTRVENPFALEQAAFVARRPTR
jgi:hypothetical protein